jgi:hypothetical protein
MFSTSDRLAILKKRVASLKRVASPTIPDFPKSIFMELHQSPFYGYKEEIELPNHIKVVIDLHDKKAKAKRKPALTDLGEVSFFYNGLVGKDGKPLKDFKLNISSQNEVGTNSEGQEFVFDRVYIVKRKDAPNLTIKKIGELYDFLAKEIQEASQQ